MTGGDDLLALMRDVPAAVVVVTVDAGGQRVGLTITSFTSLALEPPIGLWSGIPTRDGALGAPLLEGALGWLECEVAGEHPAGDHTLFVGAVATAERGPGREALVRLRQSYS